MAATLPIDTRVLIIAGYHKGFHGWVMAPGILYIDGLGSCYVSAAHYVID